MQETAKRIEGGLQKMHPLPKSPAALKILRGYIFEKAFYFWMVFKWVYKVTIWNISIDLFVYLHPGVPLFGM